MKTNELLANLRVASPCRARWGDMIGDDRARFCAQCQKHVYNLSTLTAEEAAALVRSKEGKLCARFYQRHDGTVLTADCPVGARSIWSRVKSLTGAAAALALVGVSASMYARPSVRDELPRAGTRLSRAWSEMFVTVKTWLRYPPPRMVMGDICVLPPRQTPQATPKE